MSERILIVVSLLLLITGYGCETGPDASHTSGSEANGARADARSPEYARSGDARRPDVVATVIDARPVAIVNGRRVDWGEIKPQLTEAAGGTVIREFALDQRLQEEMAEHSISIDAETIARERRLMLEMLSDDPDHSIRLLSELRARQGLGTQRFEALLRRNAALRALVRDQVEIAESQVTQMHDVMHGPRRQGRLITLATLREAREARDRILAGEFFGDVAVDVSTDASAARGGLLEPIARLDPAYPEAMRRALWQLDVDEVSEPIMIDEQYALVQLLAEFAGDDVDLESVRDDLEKRVRLSQERALMDRLARHLLVNTSFNILDPSLRESWDMRHRAEPIR